MAQEKLKQVIVVGVKAIGYTVSDSGVVTDPDLMVDTHIELTIGLEDFENPEDWYAVSRAVTRAVRAKVSKVTNEK